MVNPDTCLGSFHLEGSQHRGQVTRALTGQTGKGHGVHNKNVQQSVHLVLHAARKTRNEIKQDVYFTILAQYAHNYDEYSYRYNKDHKHCCLSDKVNEIFRKKSCVWHRFKLKIQYSVQCTVYKDILLFLMPANWKGHSLMKMES